MLQYNKKSFFGIQAMKSNLKQGFALPFAVALIVIFTILFGSILTTVSFYKNQKLIAIKKTELNEISLIGLYDFYSAYNAYIQKNPQGSLSGFFGLMTPQKPIDIPNLNPPSPCNFSPNLTIPSESKPKEFLLFHYDDQDPSNQIIESCAISSQSTTTLIVKYLMTFRSNSGSGPINITSFGAE